METDIEEIQGNIFDRGAAHRNIQRLYALKRRVTVMRHAVAPLLEVAGCKTGHRLTATNENVRSGPTNKRALLTIANGQGKRIFAHKSLLK